MTLNDDTEITHSEIRPAKAHLIQGAIALSNAEEVAPYPDEIAAIAAYKAGDPDYQPSISQEDLMKELGIN